MGNCGARLPSLKNAARTTTRPPGHRPVLRKRTGLGVRMSFSVDGGNKAKVYVACD